MIFPLRLKLALLTCSFLVVGIVTVSALVLDESRKALTSEARKRGISLASNLARSARDPMLLQDDLVLARLLEIAVEEDEVLGAHLLDTDGKLVASAGMKVPNPPERNTQYDRLATLYIDGNLIVSSSVLFRDVDVGEAQIVLAVEALIAPVIERAREGILIASGALLFVGVLIAVGFSARTTLPLRRLRFAVNALAAGDLSARVEATTRDEVGDLTRAFNEMSKSLSEKNRIENAFRRYVSDHVLREVTDSTEAIALRGEMREITVLFIDIRDFTRLTGAIGPERLVAFLNESFELITSRLLEHGATVDKYIGDAILAYFGAPIESPDHPERAVAAAIAIQRSVDERNRKLESSGQPHVRLEVGIGIHTGPVVVGNIGSDLKMDYTVIGDPVNVASRLQNLAAPGEILLTSVVANRLGARVNLEPLGLQRLEGREAPVEAFRLLH